MLHITSINDGLFLNCRLPFTNLTFLRIVSSLYKLMKLFELLVQGYRSLWYFGMFAPQQFRFETLKSIISRDLTLKYYLWLVRIFLVFLFTYIEV